MTGAMTAKLIELVRLDTSSVICHNSCQRLKTEVDEDIPSEEGSRHSIAGKSALDALGEPK